MDAEHFDAFLRAITTRGSRRHAVRLLAAAAAGALGWGLVDQAGAQPSCLANGEPCDPKASSNDCCSGKCSRKKKRCRSAPKQGICTVELNACVAGAGTGCSADSQTSCSCVVTSKGFSFCGDLTEARSVCTECTTDDQCKPHTGRGSVCIPVSAGCCGGTSSLCAPPCRTPA